MAFLEIEELHVSFTTRDGLVRAVNGVSLSIEHGQTLGVVGESGSGKSVTALTVMGLTRRPNATIEGRVVLDGVDLLTLPPHELEHVRGRRVAMIFQDPLSSLHPFYRVGWQIEEAIRAHEDVSRSVARRRAREALAEVRIPNPDERLDSYPHELSGGMRQRVMIAMALVLDPEVLIADEPTTALDVTVQAQILDLIRDLQEERGTGVVLITHDLGVVAETADEVAVMYAGRIMERAPIETVLEEPEHPYTWGLLGSIPRPDDQVVAAAAHRGRATEPHHHPQRLPIPPEVRIPVRGVSPPGTAARAVRPGSRSLLSPSRRRAAPDRPPAPPSRSGRVRWRRLWS